jgi:hypothetical protein
MVEGLWGADHPYTVAAKQGLADAEKEALQKQPPAKQLSALRQEHGRLLDAIARQLNRSDEIEGQQLALQQEYYDLEEETAKNAKRAEELQEEIDAQEAGLPVATEPGAQRGLRDHFHRLLQTHVGRRDFSMQRQKKVVDDLEALLSNFEPKEEDAAMDGDISDSLPSTPNMSDGEAKEQAPKQRKSKANRQPGQTATADEDDGEWQKALGAVGRKLARRGDLGRRTVQQLAARQEARQAGQGGKAKGKGAGKGKGKANSYTAAGQPLAQPPTATYASVAAGADGAAGGQPMSSPTGQPSATPSGSVPAGGNLTGGWPNLGAPGSAAAASAAAAQVPGAATSSGTGLQAAAQVPIDAQAYVAHQAQLRRGEGFT